MNGTQTFGRGIRARANSREGTTDATVTIEHLGPEEKRLLHAHHPRLELGAEFEIAPPYDENREITVTLEPLAIVIGRLLDGGEPIVGENISITFRQGRIGHPIHLSLRQTDSEGRFRVNMIPGRAWNLKLNRQNHGEMRALITDDLQVRAGELIDLGDLQLEGRRFQPVKKNIPPVQPAPSDKP